MKTYSYYDYNEFIICVGYKQEYIKKWFSEYFLYASDIASDFTNDNEMIIRNKRAEPWKDIEDNNSSIYSTSKEMEEFYLSCIR